MIEEGILFEDDSVLIVVDIQEGFRQVISGWDETLSSILKLIRGFQALDMPIVVTEQYPKGLGRTVQEIGEILRFEPIEKLGFSCFQDEGFKHRITSLNRRKLVLCGIEAHVCLLNTTLDAIREGYEAHYVVDAISSRRQTDKSVAVERVKQSGAYMATCEMVLFQIVKRAGSEKFRKISGIVK